MQENPNSARTDSWIRSVYQNSKMTHYSRSIGIAEKKQCLIDCLCSTWTRNSVYLRLYLQQRYYEPEKIRQSHTNQQ